MLWEAGKQKVYLDSDKQGYKVEGLQHEVCKLVIIDKTEMYVEDRSKKEEKIRFEFIWQLRKGIYDAYNQRFAFGRLIWHSCTWQI